MLKFFRRYNKVILVVGGSILMVIFLLPAGMSQVFGRRFAQPFASVDGQTVSFKDIQVARREVQALTEVIPAIVGSIPLTQETFGEHWIMLRKEAREAGLIGGPQDGQNILPFAAEIAVDQYYDRLTQQYGPSLVEQMRLENRDAEIQSMLSNAQQSRLNARQRFNIPIEQLDQALADARGILRMIMLADPSPVISKAEGIEIGHALRDTATIGAAIYPLSRIADGLADPSEEELGAHFDEFQNVDPTEQDYAIGYILSPAARVEWIKLDAQVLSDRLALDPIEVNKHFLQNRDIYQNEFADERERVEVAYRRERVEAILSRLDQVMQRELARSTANLQGTSTKKTLPPEWDVIKPQRTALIENIDQVLAREFTLNEGDPVATMGSAPTWNNRAALGLVDPAGSTLQFNTQTRLSFADYVLQAQELDGNPNWGIQVGLFNTIPLTQPQAAGRNRYYVRIDEVRRAGAAQSLDQVRIQAVADWKLLRAVETLENQVDTFLDQAISNGLPEAAASWDVDYISNLTVTEIGVRTEQETAHPTLNVESLRDEVISRSRQLDPMEPVADADPDLATVAMLIPQARGLVVTELINWEPMTIESYRNAAIDVWRRARGTLFTRDLIDAFSFDAVAERHDFERLAEVGDEDDQSAEATADADEPGTGS